MNRINEFDLEPGVYADQDDKLSVVIDVITDMFVLVNQAHGHVEKLKDPWVVTRNVNEGQLTHNRLAYPLSVFKLKFVKV